MVNLFTSAVVVIWFCALIFGEASYISKVILLVAGIIYVFLGAVIRGNRSYHNPNNDI